MRGYSYFFYLSSGGHLVRWSEIFSTFGTVQDHERNISVILLKSIRRLERSIHSILSISSFFSGVEPFLAILIQGHKENISVKLF